MKEPGNTNIRQWLDHIFNIASIEDTKSRYGELVKLHQKSLDFYLQAVNSINEEYARRQGSDGRPLAIIVAHIMAWEEWQLQVFLDQKREERLKNQIELKGYHDPERRKKLDFLSVDDFNEYQAKKYNQWEWSDIQQKAIITALKLKSLFPEPPDDKWINFLENTPSHRWKLYPGKIITIPVGWYLWMVSIKHEAVTHRADLICKRSNPSLL